MSCTPLASRTHGQGNTQWPKGGLFRLQRANKVMKIAGSNRTGISVWQRALRGRRVRRHRRAPRPTPPRGACGGRTPEIHIRPRGQDRVSHAPFPRPPQPAPQHLGIRRVNISHADLTELGSRALICVLFSAGGGSWEAGGRRRQGDRMSSDAGRRGEGGGREGETEGVTAKSLMSLRKYIRSISI